MEIVKTDGPLGAEVRGLDCSKPLGAEEVDRLKRGDLVIWDNRPTLHRREPFDPAGRRILRRTQMFGEVPYP